MPDLEGWHSAGFSETLSYLLLIIWIRYVLAKSQVSWKTCSWLSPSVKLCISPQEVHRKCVGLHNYGYVFTRNYIYKYILSINTHTLINVTKAEMCMHKHWLFLSMQSQISQPHRWGQLATLHHTVPDSQCSLPYCEICSISSEKFNFGDSLKQIVDYVKKWNCCIFLTQTIFQSWPQIEQEHNICCTYLENKLCINIFYVRL